MLMVHVEHFLVSRIFKNLRIKYEYLAKFKNLQFHLCAICSFHLILTCFSLFRWQPAEGRGAARGRGPSGPAHRLRAARLPPPRDHHRPGLGVRAHPVRRRFGGRRRRSRSERSAVTTAGRWWRHSDGGRQRGRATTNSRAGQSAGSAGGGRGPTGHAHLHFRFSSSLSPFLSLLSFSLPFLPSPFLPLFLSPASVFLCHLSAFPFPPLPLCPSPPHSLSLSLFLSLFPFLLSSNNSTFFKALPHSFSNLHNLFALFL